MRIPKTICSYIYATIDARAYSRVHHVLCESVRRGFGAAIYTYARSRKDCKKPSHKCPSKFVAKAHSYRFRL